LQNSYLFINNSYIQMLNEGKGGKVLEEKWEKQIKIGEGSYGNVYKGTNKLNSQPIAIKKIKAPVGDDGVPVETIREIVILRNITHPNIIK
jgi:serine/threonine protein kinase